MKFLLKRIILLVILVLLLGVIQFFVVGKLERRLFYDTSTIYMFHFLITLFITIGLFFINSQIPKYTGYGFLVSSVFRILVSIVFLIPLIKAKVADPVINILAFMIPYFIFLIFEVSWTLWLMNCKKNRDK